MLAILPRITVAPKAKDTYSINSGGIECGLSNGVTPPRHILTIHRPEKKSSQISQITCIDYRGQRVI
jgi:hypothetical protein